MLNISADEEVAESTETFLEPAPRPNPWQPREKKKKRLRRPQIAFELADSEIEAISDACGPPSGAQVKSQEASNPMVVFDRRVIMVYGIPPSDDPSPSSLVEYEISKLRLYFSKILAEDETASVCNTYRVGAMVTNDDSRPHPLKVMLSRELSRNRKMASVAPNIFFHRNNTLPERFKYRVLFVCLLILQILYIVPKCPSLTKNLSQAVSIKCKSAWLYFET